jgi:Zn-dependent membrane protease YugP
MARIQVMACYCNQFFVKMGKIDIACDILLIQTFHAVLLAGLILFALTTMFSFITLPVEINASQRAFVWLSESGNTSYQNLEKAQDALRWPAYTYVVLLLDHLLFCDIIF